MQLERVDNIIYNTCALCSRVLVSDRIVSVDVTLLRGLGHCQGLYRNVKFAFPYANIALLRNVSVVMNAQIAWFAEITEFYIILT